MANAPEVDRWPPVWRAVARLNARSVRFARSGVCLVIGVSGVVVSRSRLPAIGHRT